MWLKKLKIGVDYNMDYKHFFFLNKNRKYRFLHILPQKVCKSAIALCTPEKVPHERTSHTHYIYHIFLNISMRSKYLVVESKSSLKSAKFPVVKQTSI